MNGPDEKSRIDRFVKSLAPSTGPSEFLQTLMDEAPDDAMAIQVSISYVTHRGILPPLMMYLAPTGDGFPASNQPIIPTDGKVH